MRTKKTCSALSQRWQEKKKKIFSEVDSDVVLEFYHDWKCVSGQLHSNPLSTVAVSLYIVWVYIVWVHIENIYHNL